MCWDTQACFARSPDIVRDIFHHCGPEARDPLKSQIQKSGKLVKALRCAVEKLAKSINTYTSLSGYMQGTLGQYSWRLDCLLSSVKLSDKDFSSSASSAHMLPKGSTLGLTADHVEPCWTTFRSFKQDRRDVRSLKLEIKGGNITTITHY